MLGVGVYITYHQLMDSKEVILDNRLYKAELDSIRTNRLELKKKQAGKNALKAAFVRQITQKVFPYWYGTKWDFNGTTEMPQEGSIACGYFVTTTYEIWACPLTG